MSTAILKACLVCGRPSLGARCGAHPGKSRWPTSTGAYDNAAYRARRKQVLLEETTCRRCGRGGRLEVDHIVPRFLGGTDERANLQALCPLHHRMKSQAEARMGRKLRRGGRVKS